MRAVARAKLHTAWKKSRERGDRKREKHERGTRKTEVRDGAWWERQTEG